MTAGALTFALWRLDLRVLGRAVVTLPAWALGLATASWAVSLGVAALRWRLLLWAFGAERPPSLRRLYRLSWEGLFFNTFLPANVAGDLMRAAVTGDAFERPSGAWLVVALDRGSGLLALLLLGWTAGLVDPGVRLPGLGLVLPSVLAGYVGLASLPVLWGRPMGERTSGRPAGLLGRLPAAPPPLRHGLGLLAAPVVSLLAHGLAAAVAWPLLGASRLPLTASLARVPLALASAYLPTVAGLGARETAFRLLFEPLDVTPERAVAASLGLLACQLAAAAVGGLVHVIAARRAPSNVTPETGDELR